MNNLMRNILIAGLGGMALYVFFITGKYGFDNVRGNFTLQAFGFGCLGGFVAGMLDEVSNKGIPFLTSWAALIVCIFVIFPMLRAPVRDDLFWGAFVYGYAAYLTWQGYNGKLRKY